MGTFKFTIRVWIWTMLVLHVLALPNAKAVMIEEGSTTRFFSILAFNHLHPHMMASTFPLARCRGWMQEKAIHWRFSIRLKIPCQVHSP